jgi:hypothetical protein
MSLIDRYKYEKDVRNFINGRISMLT